MENENREPCILDSGERVEFETGAVRDCKTGNGRCDLMPLDVVAVLLNSEVISFIESSREHGVNCLFDAIGAFAQERKFEGGWCNISDVYLPNALLDVSKHFEAGAKKYGVDNWRKGIPLHSYIDSGVRHYLKWRAGWTDENHDRAFLWNIMCCIWTVYHHPELDDWTESRRAEHKEAEENDR